MIPLPPHRTKGGGALGATGPGCQGPFGRWDDDSRLHQEDDIPERGDESA